MNEPVFVNQAHKDLYATRVKLCSACPFLDLSNLYCNECGCYAPVKATSLNESCPIGKW